MRTPATLLLALFVASSHRRIVASSHRRIVASSHRRIVASSSAAELPQPVAGFLDQHCADCHNADEKKGGLDLAVLEWNPADAKQRAKWIRLFDRVDKGEMPPDKGDLPAAERSVLTAFLGKELHDADLAEVALVAGV